MQQEQTYNMGQSLSRENCFLEFMSGDWLMLWEMQNVEMEKGSVKCLMCGKVGVDGKVGFEKTYSQYLDAQSNQQTDFWIKHAVIEG